VTVVPPPTDPLAPLREALLARARSDAAATVARADSSARAVLAAARAEADAIVADARAKGAAEAEAVVAAEQARASRAAREVVMAARRRAYDDLRDRARAAVSELRHDDVYPLLVAALRARISAELGPAASIEDTDGTVVGQVPGRRLTFSLDDLAERSVDALGADIEGLWSP